MTTVYGDETLPDITIERGQLATASNEAATATEMAMVARQYGADDVEVHQDREHAHVEVEVSGMSVEDRHALCMALRKAKPIGVAVDVTPTDGSEDYVGGAEDREVLTDAELFTVLHALPDEWHEDRHLDLSDADMESLRPLMHEHGGLVPLLEKVEQSAADGRTDGSQLNTTSTIHDNEETTDDPLTAAKQAYVCGDIGEHEMEQRVEDALAETMDEGIPVPETP